MSEPAAAETSPATPRWQPLSAIDRRVAGVLVEKAKTTPEAYPLSLNAVVTACNQKSNRFPSMDLQADAVETSLGHLRELGAVALVQGSSRVDRYRHLLYEWLGVGKVEMAVMAELLLRGAQTEGELRGRAARMEPIVDLPALRPVLDSLKGKGLIQSLTREGRGHVLSHALYQPRELERLRAEYGSADSGSDARASDDRASDDSGTAQSRSPASVEHREPPRGVSSAPAPVAPSINAPTSPTPAPVRESVANSPELANLRTELREVQAVVSDLQSALDDCRREIRELREALGA